MQVVTVSVVGASGYAGGELLRLIAAHPHFECAHAMAASSAGKAITSLHAGLTEYRGQHFESVDLQALNESDLVFLALPHGESAVLAAQLKTKVVDLGADFRLRNASDWTQFYGGEHAGTWTYGLPEFARAQIATSDRVANPGCYATAIALGAVPIANAITGSFVVVAASGTSGAGRSSAGHLTATEVMGSMTPYKVGGIHQHTPEIEQSIRDFAGVDRAISFTPLLAPMPRGILATISAETHMTIEELRGRFMNAYGSEKFVSLLDEGVQPITGATLGSNAVYLQVAMDQRTSRATITIALDNLVKGAAGQAIQNANLMCGFDEAAGLSAQGLRP